MGPARTKNITFICLFLVLLLGFAGNVYAQPNENFDLFYGYVKNDKDEPIPSGAIEAYIDNEKRGQLNFQNGQYGIPADNPFVERLKVQGTDLDRYKPIKFKVRSGGAVYVARTEPETVPYYGSMTKRQVDLFIPTMGINGFAKLEKVKPSDPEPNHTGTEVKATQDGSPAGTVTTGSDGFYAINSVAAGNCDLAFTHPGGSWKKVTKTVNVKAGEVTDAGTVILYLGDMNGDGSINILDLLWMASKIGPAGEQSQIANVNGDNQVNILDLLRVASNVGK